MENFINQFAFIKVLKGHGESGLFYEGMQNNYNLEKGSDYEKYILGASWVEMKPEAINALPTGSLFIGVTKSESAAREYIVIGKDSTGNSIWYPINGPDSAEPVVAIWEFDPVAKAFNKLFKSEIAAIAIKIKELCKPGKFYISTDVNGYLVPAFGVHNQPSDDDWADDDDDDEELREEDKEVLRALSDITSDDDDEDDDDFDQTDCIFTILNINGKMIAMTVAHGISLDDEIEETHHLLHHAMDDLESLKKRVEVLRKDLDEVDEMNTQFTEVYGKFLEDSKNINIDTGIATVNNLAPVNDDEVDEIPQPKAVEEVDPEPVEVEDLEKIQPVIEDPDDAVDEVPQPATEEEVAETVETIGEIAKQSKPVEMTEAEAALNKELAEATGIPESETRVEIRLPKNSDDFVVKETAITRAYQEKMAAEEDDAVDVIDVKSDTDGDDPDAKPANYSDADTKPKSNQDFGDW